MSNKHSLPDSLELLLDTMCNTFGGIMFIAISLIIISSVVTKTVSSMLPEEIDAKAIKQFENESADLKKQIEKLQEQENKMLQAQLQNLSPDREKMIQEIISLKQANSRLKKDLDDQNLKHELEKRENAANDEKIKKIQDKNKVAEETILVQKEDLLKKLKFQKEQTDKLQEEFDKYIPKHLTFSMEETTSKAPYFIGIENGKLFRIGTNSYRCTDEIIEDMDPINRTVTFKRRPGKGIYVGRNSESTIKNFFQKISSDRYFIWFSVGRDSFSEFYKVKQYLRRNGYHVYWEFNPNFKYSLGSGNYKAAQ